MTITANPLVLQGAYPKGNFMGNSQSEIHSKSSWADYLLPGSLVVGSLLTVGGMNDPATWPRMGFWCLALLLILGWKLRKEGLEGQKVNFPKVLLLVLGMSLLAWTISLAVAYSKAEAILSIFRHVLFVVVLGAIVWQLRGNFKGRAQAWLVGIWAVGALQGLLALGEWVGSGKSGFAPDGTQMNPNLLGTLVAMCIPAGIALLPQVPKAFRYGILATIPLMLGAVYVSGSRAALLIVLVYCLLALLFGLFSWKALPKAIGARAVVVLLLLAALLGSGVLLLKGWNRKEMPRGYSLLWDDDAMIKAESNSMEVRLVLWNKSMKMGMEHPFTGIGMGNWKLAAPGEGIKGFDAQGRYGLDFFHHPHNEFMLAFAEQGFLGLLGFLGLFVVFLWVGLKQVLGQSGSQDRLLAMACMAGVLAFAVDGMFGFPTERMEHMVVLAGYGALLVAGLAQGKGGFWGLKIGWGMAGAGLLVLLFGLGMAIFMVPKEMAAMEMRNAKAQKQWKAVAEMAQKADSWWTRLEGQSSTPFSWYKAMALVEQSRGLAQAPAMALLEEALLNVDLALQSAPANLPAMKEKGSTLALMGRHNEAAAAYGAITTVYEDDLDSWINLAICHYHLQQMDQAKQAMAHVPTDYNDPNNFTLRQLLQIP